MIYDALQKGPFRVPGFHDPDSVREMGILFRPDTWTANTVYYRSSDDNYDIIIPTVFTGLYYKVKSPGKSGATEPPLWSFVEGEETADGVKGLLWEGINYNLLVPEESVNSVTNVATNSVTISNTANTASRCTYTIETLPQQAIDAGKFDVTSHVVLVSGKKFDVTLRFKVGNR
jgi:hypothetical protein